MDGISSRGVDFRVAALLGVLLPSRNLICLLSVIARSLTLLSGCFCHLQKSLAAVAFVTRLTLQLVSSLM